MRVSKRYSAAILGPASVAFAQFLASVMLIRSVSLPDFGAVSLLFLIIQFGFALSNALLCATLPIDLSSANDHSAMARFYFRANFLLSSSYAVVVGAIAVLQVQVLPALSMGVYAGLMMLRWFGRSFAYASGRQSAAIRSDLVYGLVLLTSLGGLASISGLDVFSCSLAFVLAAAMSLTALGTAFIRVRFPLGLADLVRTYWSMWQQHTKWATLGVVSTEATVNAHAYLITTFVGTAGFATVAAAALLARPVGLCLNAVTELERPATVKLLVSRDFHLLTRTAQHIRIATTLSWFATAAVATAVIFYFPEALADKGYSQTSITWAAVMWFLIMAARAFRTAPSLLLQAAGDFRRLTWSSIASGAVSIVGAAALLHAFGPVASLGGVLAGDIALAAVIAIIARRLTKRFLSESAPGRVA